MCVERTDCLNIRQKFSTWFVVWNVWVDVIAAMSASKRTGYTPTKKARCREEVAAGLISNTAREEVHRIQRRHRIWEE